jgi:hypothetical protein
MFIKIELKVWINDNFATKVCSLGQITEALFAVGGQYRRSM